MSEDDEELKEMFSSGREQESEGIVSLEERSESTSCPEDIVFLDQESTVSSEEIIHFNKEDILKFKEKRSEDISDQESPMNSEEATYEVPSWGDRIGPKKLNHRHKLIIQLAAIGVSNNKIAEELLMTPSRISIILGNSQIKAEIKAVRDKYYGDNVADRFKRILPKTIDTAEEIMNNKHEKGQVRLQASSQLMDRALGKPQQSVKVEGNLLSELLLKLDQEKATSQKDEKLADVTKKLDKPKDTIDTFVEEFLPEEDQLIVGKKETDE